MIFKGNFMSKDFNLSLNFRKILTFTLQKLFKLRPSAGSLLARPHGSFALTMTYRGNIKTTFLWKSISWNIDILCEHCHEICTKIVQINMTQGSKRPSPWGHLLYIRVIRGKWLNIFSKETELVRAKLFW